MRMSNLTLKNRKNLIPAFVYVVRSCAGIYHYVFKSATTLKHSNPHLRHTFSKLHIIYKCSFSSQLLQDVRHVEYSHDIAPHKNLLLLLLLVVVVVVVVVYMISVDSCGTYYLSKAVRIFQTFNTIFKCIIVSTRSSSWRSEFPSLPIVRKKVGCHMISLAEMS